MRCLYHLTKDGVCILRCYSLDSIAELPSKIEGKPVTELGAYAFSDHFSMEDYEKEKPFKDVLLRTPEVAAGFTEEEIDAMLDPHNYVGLAPEFVDRVVAKYSKN